MIDSLKILTYLHIFTLKRDDIYQKEVENELITPCIRRTDEQDKHTNNNSETKYKLLTNNTNPTKKLENNLIRNVHHKAFRLTY